MPYISNELHENEDISDDDLVYDSDTENNGEDDAYIAQYQNHALRSEEQKLANNTFIHGRSFASDKEKSMREMDLALSTQPIPKFRGIRLDTCCNKSSVMSYDQYKAYCMEFQVPFKLSRGSIKKISGIGGAEKAIVTAKYLYH